MNKTTSVLVLTLLFAGTTNAVSLKNLAVEDCKCDASDPSCHPVPAQCAPV